MSCWKTTDTDLQHCRQLHPLHYKLRLHSDPNYISIGLISDSSDCWKPFNFKSYMDSSGKLYQVLPIIVFFPSTHTFCFIILNKHILLTITPGCIKEAPKYRSQEVNTLFPDPPAPPQCACSSSSLPFLKVTQSPSLHYLNSTECPVNQHWHLLADLC